MAIEDSTPTQLEREKIAKGVYDHLIWLCETDAASEQSYLQKSYKFLNIHVIQFAALSYGLSRLETMNASGLIALCSILPGVIAAIYTSIGFFCALRLIGISEKSSLGIKVLQKVIKSKQIVTFPSDKFWTELSENLTTSIQENRCSDEQLKSDGTKLNQATRRGFLFVILFIFIVTCGNVLSRQGEIIMPDENKDKTEVTIVEDTVKVIATDEPTIVEGTHLVINSKKPRGESR